MRLKLDVAEIGKNTPGTRMRLWYASSERCGFTTGKKVGQL